MFVNSDCLYQIRPKSHTQIRLRSSTMVSTFGSSNKSGDESAYTPMAFTVLLWPEYKAEAELALSVMIESMEDV